MWCPVLIAENSVPSIAASKRRVQAAVATPCCCEVLCMWSKRVLIDKQAKFWVVLVGGSTLQAACAAVGVNRRTGPGRRRPTGGRILPKTAAPAGRYLSLAERLQMADLGLAGATVRAVATELGRSPSTVSRELRCNGPAPGARAGGKYLPYAAQKRAELRGRRPKASKFDNPNVSRGVFEPSTVPIAVDLRRCCDHRENPRILK
jgi:transposase-like protein